MYIYTHTQNAYSRLLDHTTKCCMWKKEEGKKKKARAKGEGRIMMVGKFLCYVMYVRMYGTYRKVHTHTSSLKQTPCTANLFIILGLYFFFCAFPSRGSFVNFETRASYPDFSLFFFSLFFFSYLIYIAVYLFRAGRGEGRHGG